MSERGRLGKQVLLMYHVNAGIFGADKDVATAGLRDTHRGIAAQAAGTVAVTLYAAQCCPAVITGVDVPDEQSFGCRSNYIIGRSDEQLTHFLSAERGRKYRAGGARIGTTFHSIAERGHPQTPVTVFLYVVNGTVGSGMLLSRTASCPYTLIPLCMRLPTHNNPYLSTSNERGCSPAIPASRLAG